MTLTEEPFTPSLKTTAGADMAERGTRPGPAVSSGDDLGDRLLAAAAEVFAERGYEKAGVAEIARRAGVTTGAIYARYPGKADLLVEAIDPHAGDDLEALFADHRFQGRMSDILLAAGANLVRDAMDDQASALLFESFAAARRHDDVAAVLRNRVTERHNRLSAVVDAAKAQGGIDSSIDTESLVTFCHAVGFGFILIDALGLAMPDADDWQHLIARLVEALGGRDGEPSPPHQQGEAIQ